MKSNIALTFCKSTQIAAYSYEAATNTLSLQLKKDGASYPYHYSNVTPEMFAEFEKAESKGRFFGQRLRNEDEAHPFTKMIPDPEPEQDAV